jgi:hypothetical protein
MNLLKDNNEYKLNEDEINKVKSDLFNKLKQLRICITNLDNILYYYIIKYSFRLLKYYYIKNNNILNKENYN